MRVTFALALSLLFAATSAEAHLRTLADSGRPLFWPNPSLNFFANPANTSGLSPADISALLGPAVNAWAVDGSSARARYAQSSGYPASSANDGLNAIYFSSAAGRNIDYGVVALTEVLYYVNSGQIAETDIVFNDQRFLFTKNEGDTGRTINGRTAIFLRDVATHEAGHAFGFDHSIVNLSSLVYTAFSGQFTLGDDDQAGIRTAYPSAGGNGSLSGVVNGRNGGIFGAHVAAISLQTGRIAGATIANPDGSFRLGDIPPGEYSVMMEPYSADISSISGFYQNVNHRFCGSSRFRRRFYGPCGTNIASVVEVRGGSDTSLGALAPSCSGMGNPSGNPLTLATALDLSTAGSARYGTLRPGTAHYYRIRGVAGNLQAKALSYSLYSPIDVRVEILDANGAPLSGASAVDNIQDPMPGGYKNYDSSASADVVTGNYVVRVTAAPQRIYSTEFAAGFDLLDSEGHYLLTFAVNGSHGGGTVSDMSACASVNNSSQQASTRAPAAIREEETESGCGALNGSDAGPWNGAITQLLTMAGLLHLALHLTRRKARLVRRRK